MVSCQQILFLHQVGAVLQDSDAQFVGLSVGEDIAYALENENMPREEMIPRVYQSAKMVDMHEFLNHVPYDLSGGQMQLVAFIKILARNPKLILLDEPTKGLDAYYKEKIGDLLEKLSNKVTVIIVSHDYDFLEKVTTCICDIEFNKIEQILYFDIVNYTEDNNEERLTLNIKYTSIHSNSIKYIMNYKNSKIDKYKFILLEKTKYYIRPISIININAVINIFFEDVN